MKKMDLTETTVTSETVFKGVLLHVKRDTARLPDGRTAPREYIIHPGAVAMVALLDSGEVVLERQFRYPARREFIEIPAGKIDPDEDPLETGRRELREETGYAAREWTYLTTIHPGIGYTNERILIYLARGLVQERAKLDEGEFLEVFSVPVATALDWVREGRINDVKSMIGLFWLDKFLRGEWSPPADPG